MEWYTKALQAANRMDPAHTSPWKLASTYALLCIAESLGSGRPTHCWWSDHFQACTIPSGMPTQVAGGALGENVGGRDASTR